MKMSMIVMLVVSAMLCSMAFATPQALSSTQLQSVVAGEATVNEDAENAIAVDGESNQVAGAVANTEGIATHGEGNVAVDFDGNVAIGDAIAGDENVVSAIDQSGSLASILTGDNFQLGVEVNAVLGEVEDGSVAVAGSMNNVDVTNDVTEIEDAFIGGMAVSGGTVSVQSDGELVGGGSGIIAKTADVEHSFNLQSVSTAVCAKIDDSFNVDTNSSDISGQECVSALINASNLDQQFIGLNVKTDSATSALNGTGSTGLIGALNGNAIVLTAVEQKVINGSLVGDIDFERVTAF